jgi:hypothetical protein
MRPAATTTCHHVQARIRGKRSIVRAARRKVQSSRASLLLQRIYVNYSEATSCTNKTRNSRHEFPERSAPSEQIRKGFSHNNDGTRHNTVFAFCRQLHQLTLRCQSEKAFVESYRVPLGTRRVTQISALPRSRGRSEQKYRAVSDSARHGPNSLLTVLMPPPILTVFSKGASTAERVAKKRSC